MLNLCSADHDEICYEGRKCPVCDILNRYKETVEELEDEIDTLKSEIVELSSLN